MICPNCGEPVQTRHLFCVVCGADLKDVRPEKVSERMKHVFRKDAAKDASPQAPAAAAAPSQEPDSVVLPDLMRNFT